MKQYYGIFFSVIYALFFRFLSDFNIIEINSYDYFLVVPIVLGYIPFLFDQQTFVNSIYKTFFFSWISSFLFLLIAFIFHLEDIGCLIILIPTYFIVSPLVGIIIRSILKYSNKERIGNLKSNGFLLLIIPIIIGNIEKRIEKKETHFVVEQSVIINTPNKVIWGNLFAVPVLTNYMNSSAYNFLGFPNPVRSDYNPKTNVRLGYFDNGIILHEKVIDREEYKKLSFAINVQKSKLDNSQTFMHVIKKESMIFNSITYKLQSMNESKTRLTLLCDYKVRTNIPLYGEFCSKNIIVDFESKLLNALKKKIEN
ncbi:hypothetical protein ACFSJW_01195 [Flavobacterium artemisiae]|uniref:Polyketide cyclase / dehydrase and lipid transport n=1 Tax=Flavobacterium artemisiae TaxID=2126556 RepID=A0ABW4HHX9_9FLAO